MSEPVRPDRAAWEGEMFRLLAENVLDYALFIVDPGRHVLSWSKGAERLLGFAEGEIVGRRCDLFFTPEDVRAGVPQRELDQAAVTGRGEDDRWHVRKDGTRFWASGVVTPLRDEAGRLRAFAKIMRDRTDLKRAADARRDSERRFRTLVTAAPVGIFQTDPAGHCLFVNDRWCRITGLTPDEAAGDGWARALHPNDRDRVRDEWYAAAAAGREFASEYRFHTPDGRTVWVRGQAVALRDEAGAVTGHLGTVTDTTEQRQAADAVRESEERLRALSDNLPNGAVYQIGGTPEGGRRYLYVSAGVERLFGVTPAEVMADATALYGLIHEDDRPRVAAAEEAAVRDMAPFDCEFRSWTRAGDLRWVHGRSAPRRLPTGETVWEGVVLDVTERWRAERRRAARLAVTQALADAATVEEAAPRVLQALCGGLGWDLGGMWRVDGPVVRCVGAWHGPDVRTPEFAAMTRRITLGPGVGLPGRVWAAGRPEWVADVGRDGSYPRAATASREGLHGACGFPVVLGGEVLGVIEFFSHDVREPDPDLLEMMATVGSQVGQFMERKRAEDELRRSERDLADFFDNATLGLHWVGPDGTVLRVNRAELDMLGYRRDEYVGRHIAEFHADRPTIDDILRRLGAGEEVRDAEARMRCKDGSVKHVLINSSVLWDDGRFVHTRCFTRDVTEQRRAAEALRESEERFARFMQHLPGLAWIKDARGRYVFANDAAVRAFRTARADLYGKTDADVFPPDTAARFRANDDRALAAGAGVQAVETLEQADGLHHSLVTKFPIPGSDGRAALVGGMAIDVTEQVRSRAVLEESEERFRQLAENITEVFWLADPLTGRIPYISPAFEAVWGRPRQTLYEHPGSFLDAVHPDDREHVRVASLERQRRGEAADVEYRVVRPDGSVRWVRDRSFPVKDGAGRVYRTAGIAEDITEQKRAEQALREADRRKDEFLATLAHELRNPLAPLRNGLQVMKLARDDPGAVEHARGMMERQLAQMVRLIDDLLDVSRITRGKLELRRERVPLAAVVEAAVEASRPLAEAAGHRLAVDLPPDRVWLDADPTRLAQVFSNLLNNAAKYTDPGGRIRLTARRDGGEVVVAVGDTGIGIAPEHLPRLFEMFSQVAPALERSQGGLGIGLALVRGLVEMHGGTVAARSEGPGRGSEFVVRLPAAAGPPVPAAAGPAPGTAHPKRRVVVADDNRDAADSLATLLRLAGHEVHTAHDGREAVAAAARVRPDLAVLDIGMPGLTGYDVARRIRAEPWGRRITLVALTGWGQDEDKRRAADAGFDHHLTKPADPAVLHDLLARAAPAG